MADNPITVSLPADLPEDWAEHEIVAPEGQIVGLTQQHGYNYLMQQVNAAQQAAEQIGQAFLGIPNTEDVDPAGSAAAVQANLTAHTGNTSNPHGVTAAQTGARPNTWVPAWGDVTGKPSTFPPSGHTHDASQIVSGILPASRGGTGVGSIAALARLLAGQGLGKMTVGSYVGTGVMGPSNPNSITCAFPIKAVFMMRIGMLPCGLGYFNKSGSWYYTSIIESMYTAQSGFQQNIGFGHDNSFTKRYAQFSSDRKTVSWYCVYDDATDNPGAQFNEAGETYEWIAFG